MAALSLDPIVTLRVTCRESFFAFTRYFWECVPGAGKLVYNWHIGLLCDELQKVAERVFRNEPKEYDLVINLPFGTSKSSIVSILFPTWVWTRRPDVRTLTFSHTDDLVMDLSNKARAVILSEKYQEAFPEVKLRHDAAAKGYYINVQGGDRKTATVAGRSPTGFHGLLLLGDDPIDPKKVLSEAELKTAKQFMTDVLPSRKTNKKVAATILVMQRLGIGDPTDVMLKEAEKPGAAKVRHICLPAELERNEDGTWNPANVNPPELVDNYVDGLLDPIRLDRDVLAEYKARGSLFYETQLQQRPFAAEGGLFKASYFNQRIKAAPYHAKRILYIDRASTSAKDNPAAAFTACVLMAKDADSNYYVELVKRGQWEPVERNNQVRALALRLRTRYGPHNEPRIYFEEEGGSSGKDAAKGFTKALAGFPVFGDRVSGNKELRAEPWSSQLAAKNVYIVDNGESEGLGKAEWNIDEYIMEHVAFPLGAALDQVDGSSGAYNLLSGKSENAMKFRIINLNDKRTKGPRIVVCSEDELKNLAFDGKCILCSIQDPPLVNDPPQLPTHALNALLDSVILPYLDIDPEDYQDRWEDPITPYPHGPEKLKMQRGHGKQFWAWMLKKRQNQPDVIVIADNGDRRAQSMALALVDQLHLPRQAIYLAAQPDKKVEKEQRAENPYVYAMTRDCRSMVVG